MLPWIGVAGALAFPIVFLVDGWTRRGYSSLRHTVSALATGSRRWLQTLDFVVCGVAIAVGAIALAGAGLPFLAIAVGVFAIGLVASGVFPMDPMRGYPPGTEQEDPAKFSTSHGLHDVAGAAVFFTMPAMPAVVFLTDEHWPTRITAAAVSVGLIAGVMAFNRAWERDGALTGLIQKLTLIVACVWLAATFAAAA